MMTFFPRVRWMVVFLASSIAASTLRSDIAEFTSMVKPEHKQSILEALPAHAPAKPAKERKLLVFTLTKTFRHSSIPHGVFTFDEMGKKTGAFTIEHSEDPAVFAADNLARFDGVVMLNTTGELFDDPALKDSLVQFVKSGKGLIGIHAASDTFHRWPEYGLMMGGYFDGHPWHENVLLKVEDPGHSTCACFKEPTFKTIDEIYQYKPQPYSRDRLRILLSLDPSGTNMTKNGMKRSDNDYPVGWVQKYGEGRVFYCNLGHREQTYWNPVVLQHFLAGVQFAVGDLEGETTPSGPLAK